MIALLRDNTSRIVPVCNDNEASARLAIISCAIWVSPGFGM